jgi:hypothetical protein
LIIAAISPLDVGRLSLIANRVDSFCTWPIVWHRLCM